MTLTEWAQAEGLTDRDIAQRMTAWLLSQGIADAVSVPAVQTYRAGRVPKRDRMRAIFAVSGGWVTANDFFDLPVLGR